MKVLKWRLRQKCSRTGDYLAVPLPWYFQPQRRTTNISALFGSDYDWPQCIETFDSLL